ncbi:MAG: TIGR03084 family metal-binding protein [Acidimicrobiia bacterium]
MGVDMHALADDLVSETRALEGLLDPLTEAEWESATPAEGWSIRDQVSHLAYFDEAATLSAVDPDAFRHAAEAELADIDAFTARVAAEHRDRTGEEQLACFRDVRARMIDVMATLDPSLRVPWYGSEMSAASSLTARIMETWAHGQDVADALATTRAPTPTLQHVAFLGVRAFANSYRTRGLPVPDTEVRVVLHGPAGETWSWGPDTASNRVEGPAFDFCLVVTQRRHVDDTALRCTGDIAIEWMTIAQAFAGPPGIGRRPGQFAGNS